MWSFQLGREDSFQDVYSGLWGPIFTRARRMGLDEEAAADIAQKVLVRVYLGAGKAAFEHARQLWGWVHTIAAREVYKHWKQRRPEIFAGENVELFLQEPAEASHDPQRLAQQAELLEHLSQCMERLIDGDRLFLLGPLVQGLTFRQAAALHGKSLGQFKHRYEKALNQVRECMKTKGHS